MRRFVAGALAVILSAPTPAETQSCRGYPESAKRLIKSRVEALRLVEREAADRLRGLDTRTFTYLAAEARKAADLIGDAQALKDEDRLNQCRNAVPPVRHICRNAALSLASVLDEQEAGAATKDTRQAFADAMPRCERLMGLPPLNTAWRSID